MSNKLLQLPSLLHATDIATICQPLKQLHINYFAHVNVDKAGKFSTICSSPGFTSHYISNQYYNADIHMADTTKLGSYVVWDAVERKGLSAKMHEEASQFGVKHTFTIIEKGEKGTDCYHFASTLLGRSINQVYMSNLDLLKYFILHFKEKVSQSKILSSSYDYKFHINKEVARYDIVDGETIGNNKHKREKFLSMIELNKHLMNGLTKPLSFREIEILTWLHHGKTAHEIAVILGIADVTVNKHILHIKEKTQCYSQFQLGEFYSKLFHHSEEIMQVILKRSK